MSDELVEAVARAIDKARCSTRRSDNCMYFEPEARAAIAIIRPRVRNEALEEAAQAGQMWARS